MLKKTYRIFLILGMAAGVVAGIFFFCSAQRQITDTAEAAAVRRQNEQNAKVYLSPKEVGKNTLFSLSTMTPEESGQAARCIPQDWKYAPVAETPGGPPAVTANRTTSSEAAVLYSTPDFFEVRGMELMQGSLETSPDTCAASASFLTAYGLELGDAPQVEIQGRTLRITAVFAAPEQAGNAEELLNLQDTSLLLVLPYEAAVESEPLYVSYLDIKKPEGLSIEEFEERLAQLQAKLNERPPREDVIFHAASDVKISESSTPSSGTLVYLGIFFIALLGEFLAGVNMMSLAGAGVLESKRKIGLKLAVGASYRGVFRELLGELLLLCAKGLLLGSAVSSVLVYCFNDFLGDFLFLFNAVTVLLAAAVIFCACLAAAYFPFHHILKRQPADLLRQE